MSIDLIRTFLLKSKAANRRSFISDLFKSMDKDHSRRIDYTEFRTGLRNLGLIDITENEFRRLFNTFDVNKDGLISYDEFVAALKPGLNQVRLRAIEDAFKKLDVNHDGILSIEDFRVVYLEQAKSHPKVQDGSWSTDDVINLTFLKMKFKMFK
jgi:Ca2+-binding EF-hand superfamily protein